ncbi:MAG: hypothetical protein HRU20_29045, partial [Pseudomonadales bacterium]|nr:hypothetical protein [Pseudomonadales bacterium]
MQFYYHKSSESAEWLGMALKRSFTHGVVKYSTDASSQDDLAAGVYVFQNPSDDHFELLQSVLSNPLSKVIIFGQVTAAIAQLLQVSVSAISPETKALAECENAVRFTPKESIARLEYDEGELAKSSAIQSRALKRFDFMDEWNNLGFGAISFDNSPWAVSQVIQLMTPARLNIIASVTAKGNIITPFILEMDEPDSASLLWVNREVGLLDSHEWSLVEYFVANYKSDSHFCMPFISEIPYGYDAAVTMRLDCDEDIASARQLFDYYQSEGIPLSLAIKTSLPEAERHFLLLDDVIKTNGSILSHTVNHYCNWGENFEQAYDEAKSSKGWLEEKLDAIKPINYAVSPFHQNPDYAVQALEEAGFTAFISGIIANDPQYLLARGGRVSGQMQIISHTQQCMLHGDCGQEGSLDSRTYKQQFDQAKKAHCLFGYLDHPFSDRYQYGWTDEDERQRVHSELVHYAKQSSTLFMNE